MYENLEQSMLTFLIFMKYFSFMLLVSKTTVFTTDFKISQYNTVYLTHFDKATAGFKND
jgi:hypothetical protein